LDPARLRLTQCDPALVRGWLVGERPRMLPVAAAGSIVATVVYLAASLDWMFGPSAQAAIGPASGHRNARCRRDALRQAREAPGAAAFKSVQSNIVV